MLFFSSFSAPFFTIKYYHKISNISSVQFLNGCLTSTLP